MDKEMRKYFDAQFLSLKSDLSKEIGEASHSVKLLATHIDKRFDVIDERFNAIDKRLEAIDDNLSSLNRNTHNHEKRLSFLEESLPKLA